MQKITMLKAYHLGFYSGRSFVRAYPYIGETLEVPADFAQELSRKGAAILASADTPLGPLPEQPDRRPSAEEAPQAPLAPPAHERAPPTAQHPGPMRLVRS